MVTLVVALVALACAAPPAERPETGPAREGRPAAGAPTAPAAAPTELIERMVADLAERAGAATDPIEIREAEAVTWPDAALGCPEPGRMYAQMLVPGFRVVLEVGGRSYDYHAAESGRFVLCETPDIENTRER